MVQEVGLVPSSLQLSSLPSSLQPPSPDLLAAHLVGHLPLGAVAPHPHGQHEQDPGHPLPAHPVPLLPARGTGRLAPARPRHQVLQVPSLARLLDADAETAGKYLAVSSQPAACRQGLLMLFAASIHAFLSMAYMSPRYQDIVFGQVILSLPVSLSSNPPALSRRRFTPK